MKPEKTKLIITVIVLFLAAISPNLFPYAETGAADFSSLALKYLIPSAALIFIIIGVTWFLKYNILKKQIINGIVAGLVATIALEIVREIGFRLGGMPGDLPKLMGVLLLDKFAEGPGFWSNIAGWAYHFWNGAVFGIIYSLLLGRGKTWMGIVYGLFLGIGFMISPVTRTLGIGAFGFEFKDGYQFLITVTLAHAAYGALLSFLIYKMNKGLPNFIKRIKEAFGQTEISYA
ncbi:MAG: hypothetical protein ABIR03_11055 [Ginsengibacter sp.]